MNGRITTTPWARNALAAYVPGGLAAIAPRVPEGHALLLSGRSARGPWQVELTRHGARVFSATTTAAELPAAIEKALVTVWP